MYNKLGLLIGCMIFLFTIIPLVDSAPPVSQVQQFTEGYVLKYPSDQILKQSQDYEFEFHVFNISNGMPKTAGIVCYFHLYGSSGEPLLEMTDSSSSDNFDYSFNVTGGNFSVVGDYYYITQCNSSALGGYVESPIQVTPNGLEITTGRAMVDIGLLFMLIVLFISCVLLMIQFNNLLVKVASLGFAYLFLISITFISWNMASDFLLSAPYVAEIFKIMFFVLIIGFFPLVVGAFAYYIYMITKVKEIERLMTKGLGYDEAERRSGRKFR